LSILGYYPFGHVANGYNGIVPMFAASTTNPLAYQATVDPIAALTYAQQLQQQQPQQSYLHAYQPNAIYQSQLAQLLALRQGQFAQAQHSHLQTTEQVNFVNHEGEIKIKAN